jgi:NDP-sugar pyrophosphorylase family protein
MKSFKILAAVSVIALSATSAFAQTYGSWGDQSSSQSEGGIGSHILNNQINLQTNWSNLNAQVDTIGGDVVAQGSAGGNLIDITTMNNTRVFNNQIVGPDANIGSNVNLDANNVWGSVGIQNKVLCNGASVSTDPVLTAITSNQECHATDPYSSINANISNLAGNAVFQGSALGNSFQADSNAPNMPIMSRQLNNSGVISNVNASVFNAGGSVGLSSSAIGNTSQIIHYNTN